MNIKAQTAAPVVEHRARRRPRVTRTVLPDADRRELLDDALEDLAAGRDARDEPHAAEAIERLLEQTAARCARLEACVIAVATADLETLPVAIALCRREVRR